MSFFNEFYLDVSPIHSICVYEYGNPNGIPVIFLHGGPGGNINEKSTLFFDDSYHVILFDQRGTGKSKPFLELKDNTPFHIVEDIEKIRKYFNLDKFILFGGSYGSTLSLLYAIKYPEHLLHMVLRGIFLSRKEDIDWLYEDGASYFFPEEHRLFKNFVGAKNGEIINAYFNIFTGQNEKLKKEAAMVWSNWENGLVTLIPNKPETEYTDNQLSMACLECVYFKNKSFFPSDNYILENSHIFKDIPTHIVHGRYDVDCRPVGALELKDRLTNAELIFADASGHSPYENNMLSALKNIMHNLSQKYSLK